MIKKTYKSILITLILLSICYSGFCLESNEKDFIKFVITDSDDFEELCFDKNSIVAIPTGYNVLFNSYTITLHLSDNCNEQIFQFTTKNLGNKSALYIDSILILESAVISEPIRQAIIVIDGLDKEKYQNIISRLKKSNLPIIEHHFSNYEKLFEDFNNYIKSYFDNNYLDEYENITDINMFGEIIEITDKNTADFFYEKTDTPVKAISNFEANLYKGNDDKYLDFLYYDDEINNIFLDIINKRNNSLYLPDSIIYVNLFLNYFSEQLNDYDQSKIYIFPDTLKYSDINKNNAFIWIAYIFNSEQTDELTILRPIMLKKSKHKWFIDSGSFMNDSLNLFNGAF